MELESLHSGQNRDQTGERQNLKKIYVGCRARSLARHKPAMRILVFWFWFSGFLVFWFWFLPLAFLVFTSCNSGFYFRVILGFLVFTVGKNWGKEFKSCDECAMQITET